MEIATRTEDAAPSPGKMAPLAAALLLVQANRPLGGPGPGPQGPGIGGPKSPLATGLSQDPSPGRSPPRTLGQVPSMITGKTVPDQGL
jgi:hypothetical protein